jgi:hypothetical protein
MAYLGVEITARVEHMLKTNFFKAGFKFDIFRKLLRECNAVIAGGSILSIASYSDYRLRDIDIYVRCEDSKPILQILMGKVDYKQFRKGKFSRYSETFLNRNGIRCIYYSKYNPNTYYADIDIMTVRNSKSPLDVIKAFDLTFCQVWYDGDKVYANYPEDIKNKIGSLEDSYTIPLLNMNKFLVERYEKYTNRGFNIKINYPEEHTIVKDMMGIEKSKKFKHLSIDEINKFYDTDDKRKKMITRMILAELTMNIDDSGYDTDDYDSIESFNSFGEDKVNEVVQNIKNKLIISSDPKNYNWLLLQWMKLLKREE